MDRPQFDVNAERLRAYADMFEITLTEADAEAMAAQMAAGLAGLAELRSIDLDGIEPFAAFPVDRAQP